MKHQGEYYHPHHYNISRLLVQFYLIIQFRTSDQHPLSSVLKLFKLYVLTTLSLNSLYDLYYCSAPRLIKNVACVDAHPSLRRKFILVHSLNFLCVN